MSSLERINIRVMSRVTVQRITSIMTVSNCKKINVQNSVCFAHDKLKRIRPLFLGWKGDDIEGREIELHEIIDFLDCFHTFILKPDVAIINFFYDNILSEVFVHIVMIRLLDYSKLSNRSIFPLKRKQ